MPAAEIDWRKAIVPQLPKLEGGYARWVHTPVLSRECHRFFDSDILEAVSQTPWYVVPLLWLPIAACVLVSAVARIAAHTHAAGAVAVAAAAVAAGHACWWIAEYLIHRFAFHVDASSPLGITAHFLLHGCHHKFPMDTRRLVFPPVPAAPVIYLFFAAYRAAVRSAVSPVGLAHAIADAVFAGSLFCYVAYDCTHYYIHRRAGQRSEKDDEGDCAGSSSLVRWMRQHLGRLRRAHMAHHYQSHSHNFGISNACVDRVFGTQLKPR